MSVFDEATTEFGLVTIDGGTVSEFSSNVEIDPVEGTPGFFSVVENPMASERQVTELTSPTEASAVFDALRENEAAAAGTKVIVLKEAGSVDGQPVYRALKAVILRAPQ